MSLIALARLTKPVGLKGGLRAQLLCDGPDRLRQISAIHVGVTPEETRPGVLMEVSGHDHGVVIFLEGCSSREEAEALRGHFLFIPSSESVPSEIGRPRIDDLLECTVVTADGRHLGKVTDVYDAPGHRVLGVSTGSREVLVPEVEAWIVDVDVITKNVILASDELFREE